MNKNISILIAALFINIALYTDAIARGIAITYSSTGELIGILALYIVGFMVICFVIGLISKLISSASRSMESESELIVRKSENEQEIAVNTNNSIENTNKDLESPNKDIESSNDDLIAKILTETFTFYESSILLRLFGSKRLKHPFITISPTGFRLSDMPGVIPWRMLKDISISRMTMNMYIKMHYIITYTFTDEFINSSQQYIPNKKFTAKKPTYIQTVKSVRKPGTIDIFAQIFHLFCVYYR